MSPDGEVKLFAERGDHSWAAASSSSARASKPQEMQVDLDRETVSKSLGSERSIFGSKSKGEVISAGRVPQFLHLPAAAGSHAKPCKAVPSSSSAGSGTTTGGFSGSTYTSHNVGYLQPNIL